MRIGRSRDNRPRVTRKAETAVTTKGEAWVKSDTGF